jgi:signal transduction histidine kinase
MQPARVGLLNMAFRVLAMLGVPEIGAFAVNLATHPDGLGIAGQGFFIRFVLGLLVTPTMLMAGALIVWRAPGNIVGRFLILMALGGVAAQFDLAPVGPALAAWLINLLILYGAGVVAPSMGYLMLTFPDGQVYPPRLARMVILVAVVKFIGAGLEIMASPGKIKIFTPTLNPLFVPALAPYQPIIAATIGIAGILLPAIWLAGMVSLVFRHHAASVHDRRQMKWVMWALAILLPTLLFMAMGILTGYVVAGWALPLAAGFGATALALFLAATALAIVRYRLFDIDIILNRALVYGALTAGVVGVYALIVGLAGELFHQSGSLILSLLATGLIAVLFQPVREHLQRAVNRLMYGERDDPYAVLSRLGQRLESTLAPHSILPAIVETVAGALKLPYAAITLRDADADRVAAAFGLPTANTVVLPLAHQHELIGHLHVAQRSANEPFTPAEQRLLGDIARQIGVAAHNVRLTADLQRSRERLVTTREEERRRLRRDLHDGLGPTLASQSYKLDAVLDLMDSDPATARKLILDLKSQAQTTLADIRRLVYELRPPALDELGLVAALQAQFTDSANGLRISVESPPDGLPPLSAAVEVAAYRIAMEAVNNATRHARARHCVIRFGAKADELTVEITDDGTGLQGGMRAGVGLTSMRERAAELGGQCVIDSSPKRGTRVCAILPLAKEAP